MKPRFLTLIITCLAAGSAWAADHKGHGPTLPPGCAAEETRLACAIQATPHFLGDGTLVLGWVAGGRVMAARSSDGGKSFEAAQALNKARETIDANADARLALASDSKGGVFVAWATRDKAYNGSLVLARSRDGAKTFLPPKPVASDPASQRFPALAVDGRDRLYIAWIDKRGAAAAKATGHPHKGGGLGLAWSDDGGESLAHEGVALPDICECCRIGLELSPDGRPVVLWRHIFEPNIRDHAVMVFADRDHPGPIRKVAEDNWRVDACPHMGPSMAVAADGSVHVAWYTAGTARKGVFFASAAGPDAAFSEPHLLGNAANAVSHPHLLAVAKRLWMAWKEFDGETTTVQAQSSDDSGRTWSAPRPLAQTRDSSDRPILVGDGKRAFLSWVTGAEGWRLLALD
ncbi:putative signal peptide protein [Paramagnetospirillum magnetotacticum MS-1]|uniref:Putative signal peptide protein n=1 Tax=Paramagnetospirillum magnetotacticum MS-1 TaxID=272627 RepID=A0A0C2YW22_PARME|nr:hypothetical protein [Paramagnetospirillum magnetotacticum]KIL99313.1 putative signal peptide protein [Paramagnetospirillum magnetotacticum MS-1]